MNKDKIEKIIKENPISPNLKDKYKVVGVVPGLVKYQGVQYDLRKMSDEVAAKLAEDKKFRYLELITTKK